MAAYDPVGQEALRTAPNRPHIMYQGWDELLFVHYAVEPSAVQRLLPANLEVETFADGHGRPMAWLGVVPFRMRRIRGRFLPPIPWHHDFLEVNVRTYVRVLGQWPAVFFLSLDCNRPLAVWFGRVGYGLPYHTAQIRSQRREQEVAYECRRGATGPALEARFRIHGPTRVAEPDSFEHFLFERYMLVSDRKSGLSGGRVHHPPYRISDVELLDWQETLLPKLGFTNAEPAHAAYCEGVDAKVWWLRNFGRGV